MTYRHICQLGLLLSLLTQAPTAKADDDEMIILGVLGAGLVLSDVAFFVRDVALVVNESDPKVGVSVAQAAVTTPQALFMNAGMAIIAHEYYGYEEAPLVLPTSMITALMVHGTWSALRPDTDPARLFGASTIIGIDVAWASMAISHTAGGEMPMHAVGPWILGTTLPGTVVSVRQAIVDESFRSGWVATAVGSGLLVSYGFAATLGALDPEDDEHYAALTPATMRLLPWAPRGGSGTAEGSAGLLLAGSF